MNCTASAGESAEAGPSSLGLRRVDPYWHEYRTNCKQRWAGRTLLEVFVTEFRDRTSEYYQWAILQGLCRVNDRKADPDYVLKMSDQIQNKLHRHEAPITADPIRILYRNDDEGRIVIVKPGSIPVHPAGRHHKTTLVEMLKDDHGIANIATSNRLDRLTSGIMICTTKKETAHKLAEQFTMSKVRKAYVCRVKGRFPTGVTFVEEPLLIVDRQSGVSIVHPLGRYGATYFHHMWYDEDTDTTAVFCRPVTGRTHQIRVHAQWLGHPIANDPIYANAAWDKYPPPAHLKGLPLKPDRWKIDPGSTLSVYGAQEVDDIIADLKIDRDDREDWARWRDEMLFGQMLKDQGVQIKSVAGANGEKPSEQRTQGSRAEDAAPKLSDMHKGHFCEECQVPLLPDPKPDDLFIYLHAIKYETDDWTYQDVLPWWARRVWQHARARSAKDADSMDGFEMPSLRASANFAPHADNGFAKRHVAAEKLDPDEDCTLGTIAEVTTPKYDASQRNAAHPGVVLEVFTGFEDIAACDVSSRLAEALGAGGVEANAVTYTKHTGHVFVNGGAMADIALQLYREGHINCVKDAYLVIGQSAMPQDILNQLAAEKHEYHVLISKTNHARKQAKKGEKEMQEAASTFTGDLPTKPGVLPRTEAEHRMLTAIESAWLELSPRRDAVLQAWQTLTGFAHEKHDIVKPAFRATVDRSGYTMPTLTSVMLERELGNVVWDWLNDGLDLQVERWRVDLKSADLDVTLKLIPGPEETDAHWRLRDHNPAGRFVFMLHVPTKTSPKHRPVDVPNHLVRIGTPLARYRGYVLSLLLPMRSRSKHVDKAEPLKIWEPCAGTGSLAVELVGALERRNVSAKIFASDLSAEDIEKAREMLHICGTHVAKLGMIDATHPESSADFVGGDNALDAIVTDLPWGRRVLNHMTIAKLYPALLQTFCRVLRPNGVVLVMTADHRTLLRAMKIHEADARKRDLGWIFRLEDAVKAPSPPSLSAQDTRQTAPAELEEEADDVVTSIEVLEKRVRIVQCGYMVGVLLLRKVPIIA